MYTHEKNRLPRVALALSISLMGGSALSGCNDTTKIDSCYRAVVQDGDNGIESAILNSLRQDADINDLDDYRGVHATSIEVNRLLMNQHHKYHSVMPGDQFGYCLRGKEIVIDPSVKPEAND